MNKRQSFTSGISVKVGPDVPLESAHPVSIISILINSNYLLYFVYIVRADET